MFKIKKIFIITLLIIMTFSIVSCTKNERKIFIDGVLNAYENGYYSSDTNVLINNTFTSFSLKENKTLIRESSFYGDFNNILYYEDGFSNNFIIKKTDTRLSNGIIEEITNIEFISKNNIFYYKRTKITADGKTSTSYGGTNDGIFSIIINKTNILCWNCFTSPHLFNEFLEEPNESGVYFTNSIELNNNKLTFARATQLQYFSSSFIDVYYLDDYRIDKINATFNTILKDKVSDCIFNYEHVAKREIIVPQNPDIFVNLDNKHHIYYL